MLVVRVSPHLHPYKFQFYFYQVLNQTVVVIGWRCYLFFTRMSITKVSWKDFIFFCCAFWNKSDREKYKIQISFLFLSAFQGKTPVYIAQLCKSGEIFYPGDKLDDWLCDCKPGNYLRHSFKTLLESVLIVAYILLFFPI